MNTFLVTLTLVSFVMIASPRTLEPDTSTVPELNLNTFPTAKISKLSTSLIKIGTLGGISYFRDSVLRNWSDSKSFCENHDAQLAEINTKNQLNFLRNAVLNVVYRKCTLVATVGVPEIVGFWVSNTGKYDETKRFASLNRNCPILYPDFSHGYTSRFYGEKHFSLCQTVDSGESIFAIGSGSKKESSEDEDIFIFKNTYTTINTTTPQTKLTLIEIGTFRGKSYFGDQVFRDWDDSKSFCEDHGLQLAKIDNKDQLQFLRNAVRTVVRQQWSWVSNTGGNEVNRNCIRPLDRRPVLAPFGRNHMRRCRGKRFGLCQSTDFGDAYFTSVSSNKDKSSEEIQTLSESTEDSGKAVNQEKPTTKMFFQYLVDNFPRSTIETFKIGVSAIMGDYSALGLFQKAESSREVLFTMHDWNGEK